jgi:type III pantothenate kinase
LIDGAKAAGILVEAQTEAGGEEADKVPWVVLGIGVNLATAPVDMPYPVTSLAAVGSPILPSMALEHIVSSLARRYRDWLESGFPTIREAWLRRARGLGQSIELRQNGTVLTGRFADWGMLLAIDAGNTNIVFAVFEGDRIVGSWRASSDTRRTADEYAVWLTQLMGLKGLAPDRIDGSILASVVPGAVLSLKTLCRAYFNSEPMVVGEPSVDLGLKVVIDRPEDVGADRLVNAVAAVDRFKPPLIIIDFGTATTFDIVDDLGNYAGGAIAPGINLSLEALHMAAAKLPRVALRRPDRVIGMGTVTAMQSGTFWGYIGLIEGLVTRIRREYGAAMQVIATGGLAPLFADSTDIIDAVDGELTLWGLRLIHARNKVS